MARTCFVARTSVFEVRGSSLAKAPNRQDGRLPSGWGAREGRAADLNGGGLHCNTVTSCFLNNKFSLPAPSCATAILAVPEHGQDGRGTSLVAASPRCATNSAKRRRERFAAGPLVVRIILSVGSEHGHGGHGIVLDVAGDEGGAEFDSGRGNQGITKLRPVASPIGSQHISSGQGNFFG